MIYNVIVTAHASGDAHDYAQFILTQSRHKAAASRWLDELETLIASLAELPLRYKPIDEQADFTLPLHQVMHYSHRVIYHVDEAIKTVTVLRVYHTARKPLGAGDLPFSAEFK